MPFITEHAPTRMELNSCIQCGLCLASCPTFRLTGKETASPRGRLMAMTLVLDGELEVDQAFDDAMSFCLGCRACEVVCPGLVPYGRVLEGARAELSAQRPSPGRRLRRLILGNWINRRRFLRLATAGMALAQRLHLGGMFPGRLRSSFSGLRQLSFRPPTWRGRTVEPEGASKGSVGLLAGCVMDPWFGSVHDATVGLLHRGGYTVVVPAQQGCCGALAAHDGHADAAESLMATNARAFAECDMVIANAAGCSAHLKEYASHSEFPDVLDVTELVARLIAEGALPALGAPRGDVAVQDPCHLRHAQRVVDPPRSILKAAGYQPLEIDPAAMCCGAAGIYSVLNPGASSQLGSKKAAQVRATGAGLVASANPGCEMQLRSHLGTGIRVAHPVELYWEALTEEEGRLLSTERRFG